MKPSKLEAAPRLALVLACLLVPGGGLRAESGATSGGQPGGRTADDILGDFTRALGGSRARARRTSLYMKAKAVLRVRNMETVSGTGSFEAWCNAQGHLSVMTLPALKSQAGCDRLSCWEATKDGVRQLQGAEEEQTRLLGSITTDFDLERTHPRRRVVSPPPEAPTERALECVELTPASAPPMVDCFDAVTHLRLFRVLSRPAAGGVHRLVTRFTDWRWVDGVRTFFGSVTVFGPITVEVEMQRVKVGLPLDAALFKQPG